MLGPDWVWAHGGALGTEGRNQSCLNRLSMSPTRPLHLEFFIVLKVTPALPKYSLPAFATQAREKEMHFKKYESWNFVQDPTPFINVRFFASRCPSSTSRRWTSSRRPPWSSETRPTRRKSGPKERGCSRSNLTFCVDWNGQYTAFYDKVPFSFFDMSFMRPLRSLICRMVVQLIPKSGLRYLI